ncbi:MAG: hypothetical protein DI533_17175 [Cereibacter sphaeroides]|uniref:RHS repeat-associated core domain-containing protein n=1 Tax=Cereibacter sphaeroides TaxID=1063 RepID=A0A2W5RZT0_CERSP|nr:MAG: hypothetical protein DI533_17175 [Cereibacter sphaeroides]
MRHYDPTLGRYLEPDPLGLVDGASLYGYARQNPVRYTDPSGELASTGSYPHSPRQPRVSEGLCQASGEDCFEQWKSDQDACRAKFEANTISNLPACMDRARDVFNHCMGGGGGPGPQPWSAHDEDVPKTTPKPKRYGQPLPKPGVTSREYGLHPSIETTGPSIATMLLGLLAIGGMLFLN